MTSAVPFRSQLLKWIGNKQQQAAAIVEFFPARYETYFEPFLGSGGVLGVLAPPRAVASDAFRPLMEIWQTLSIDKALLKQHYAQRHGLISTLGKKAAYQRVLHDYNASPNGADLVFLCRACYGGVVRFRRHDGCMSTPVGIHDPISPESFAKRVDLWHERIQGTQFHHRDFAASMALAGECDFIYCDPPYSDSQKILYGAQKFSLSELFGSIADCKTRGARVALSIDCNVTIPAGLFAREEFVTVGRSMLKRFQMHGHTLERHVVKDRLLLTY